MSVAPRRVAIALAALALAMLAAAFGFEHLLGLQPCVLCWWQRYAWMAALAFALAAIAAGPTRAAAPLAAIAAAAALIGGGIAFHHVGVEHGWWAGAAECSSPLGTALTPEDRLRQIMAAPVVRCDEVAWSLLGVSMAGWNGLVALVGGGLALAALRRQVSKR